PDPAGAAEAYEQGTALGHDWAPANLAYLLSDGDPSVPDDIDRAVTLYHLAYERGNIEALSDLAYMYWDGVGVAQDHAEARRLLQVLADLGLPGQINDLGYMHEAGLGGPVDFDGALALYQQAASMDYPFAAWGAATVYLNPDYAGADRVEGYAWCAYAIARETDSGRSAEYQESCGTLPETLSEADIEAIATRTEELLTTY
uniref:tetratricopeptide repeat protein n=1 Tax=Nioella sediminis TaxID=1912092 RepID=UPI000A9A2F95